MTEALPSQASGRNFHVVIPNAGISSAYVQLHPSREIPAIPVSSFIAIISTLPYPTPPHPPQNIEFTKSDPAVAPAPKIAAFPSFAPSLLAHCACYAQCISHPNSSIFDLLSPV